MVERVGVCVNQAQDPQIEKKAPKGALFIIYFILEAVINTQINLLRVI